MLPATGGGSYIRIKPQPRQWRQPEFIEGPMADRVHPPIDAEVDAALRAAGESLPSTITREDIPRLREIAAAAAPSDLELQRGDAIEIEERTVPGSNGRPPVAVLIVGHPRQTCSFLAFTLFLAGEWPGEMLAPA
jgi:hypothetical protein